MAAPVPSYSSLPDDSANTGKKVRTETRIIGGSVVHEHFYVPTLGYTITGHYFFSSTQQSLGSAHDGNTTAFFWFQNPAASTVTMVLRSIIIDSTIGTTATAQRNTFISFTKATYTGTPSGASVGSLVSKAGDPAASVIIRTASTGMTVTQVGDFCGFTAPSVLTAAGVCYGSKVVYAKNPLAFIRGLDIEFAPGELMIIWQSGAGSPPDPRRIGVQVEWDEVDLG